MTATPDAGPDLRVHPCDVCGAPGRRYMNWRGCLEHSPAAYAGHPEPPAPTCGKPLTCYRSCCAGDAPKPKLKPDEIDANELVDRWKAHARAEIMVLAGLGYPFGPGDLAALLPLKLAGDNARDWLTWLLDEGIEAGAIVALGDNRWKGARS